VRSPGGGHAVVPCERTLLSPFAFRGISGSLGQRGRADDGRPGGDYDYHRAVQPKPRALIAYKLFFGLLGFSAVVTEIATLAERGVFEPQNFFSYFTIQSNILVAATLILSAVAVAAGTNDRLDAVRGAVTAYILVVGIGFSVLLAGIEGIPLTAVPWDNAVLHYIIPVAVLGDYLLDRPQRRLPFRPALLWLLYPVGYVAYSLLRGTVTDWYPYPFLDPATNGYAAVAVTVLGLLLLGMGLIWGITRISGRGAGSAAESRRRREAESPHGASP
jgi:hypothetical protein